MLLLPGIAPSSCQYSERMRLAVRSLVLKVVAAFRSRA